MVPDEGGGGGRGAAAASAATPAPTTDGGLTDDGGVCGRDMIPAAVTSEAEQILFGGLMLFEVATIGKEEYKFDYT